MSANLLAAGDRVGEKHTYMLDESRSSWAISDGQVSISFTDFKVHPDLGPAYTLRIDYMFDLGLLGDQNGSFNLLVPEKILSDEFKSDLKLNPLKDVISFKINYHGESQAQDMAGKNYDNCSVIRIFDLNNKYMPGLENSQTPLKELTLKVHPSAQVLGAIQIDIKGKFMGIPFVAGYNLKR